MIHVEGKVLLDTNVLICATLENDHRYEIAHNIVLGSLGNGVECYVSVQNLAEMYANLTGPKMDIPDTPAIAGGKIVSIASLSSVQVLSLSLEIQKLTLELCEKYGVRRQKYFDIQLVASMLSYGIPTMITENSADFNGIAEIQTLNPFARRKS